jgi:hypothetical protein
MDDMQTRPAISAPQIAMLLLAAMLVPIAAYPQSATYARTDYLFVGDKLAGDFNGDGKLDVAGLGAQTATMMLGNGDGTFQPRVDYPVASWNQALAAGDFNRDGALDLMVTINTFDIGLSLLLGRGDVTFLPAVNLPNTAHFDTPAIEAVDIDNNGTLDIILGHGIACYTAPCIPARIISVMKGNGDGTFQTPSQIDVTSDIAEIAVGDFNRDGRKDLALASSRSRVHILLGAGDGTFTQQTLTLMPPPTNIGMDNTDIDVADVNGDSIDDVVSAMSLNGSKTVILIGIGNGTFQPPQFIQEPDIRIPQYQAIADFNGDGRLDLALSLGFGLNGLFEIRNGNGDGTFGPLVLYLPPGPLASVGGQKIIAADFNADSKPDIAVTWAGASSGLAMLRNTTGTTPPPAPGTPSLTAPANGAIVTQPVTLDWNNVTNAASYEVQVDNSSTIAAPFVLNPTVTMSQVTLSGLPAQQLWWRVRARNSAGVFGPFSSTRRFTPQGVSPPPPPPPTGTATLTVVASGRSGERVTSTPSGINVSVGTTGSAPFATGTSITLRVTNSRDAIWSGACSSGGNKTKTCTFTLNGNATVTASVQ